MRQLETTELATISGGSAEALVLLGVGVFTAAVVIGALSSRPCSQVVTPVFDPYTGMYLGDMVDTYCY